MAFFVAFSDAKMVFQSTLRFAELYASFYKIRSIRFAEQHTSFYKIRTFRFVCL